MSSCLLIRAVGHFSCEKCKKAFKSTRALDQHDEAVHYERCNLYGARFQNSHLLLQHTSDQHPSPPQHRKVFGRTVKTRGRRRRVVFNIFLSPFPLPLHSQVFGSVPAVRQYRPHNRLRHLYKCDDYEHMIADQLVRNMSTMMI